VSFDIIDADVERLFERIVALGYAMVASDDMKRERWI
jgi:hypothetical protein